MTEKVTSHFHIFKCGRNLLDQLDITYQWSFIVTSAQDEYYREKKKSLIKTNIGSDGKICNENIHWVVIGLRAELDLKHEHNIKNITSEDVYTSPTKKEKVSTINDSVYYESDKRADTISDSSKQVDASNKPITDTHIVEGVNNLSVLIVNVEQAVIGVRIIVRGITQGVISGRTIIVENIVTDISLDSSNQLFETNTFQLN